MIVWPTHYAAGNLAPVQLFRGRCALRFQPRRRSNKENIGNLQLWPDAEHRSVYRIIGFLLSIQHPRELR